MLVAPLVLSVPSRSRRVHSRRARISHRLAGPSTRVDVAASAPAFLITWMALGLVVLLCVPAARGGAMLGATLPFWLVAAPLIGLVWLWRRECARVLRSSIGRRRRRIEHSQAHRYVMRVRCLAARDYRPRASTGA